MTRKNKFVTLPDVQTEGSINGMMLRNKLLTIWHEQGMDQIDTKTGKSRNLRSTVVKVFEERGSSQAVYGKQLEWIKNGISLLTEEGREYQQLAISKDEEMLAAIDAAGGLDLFIHKGNGMSIKREVAHNPADRGNIFWTDTGELISISEWTGNLIGGQKDRNFLEELEQVVITSAYDPIGGLAILDGAGTIHFFNIRKGLDPEEKCKIDGHEIENGDISFFARGSGLSILDVEKKEIRFLDIQSKAVIGKKPIPEIEGAWRLAADPEGVQLAAAIDKQVFLFKEW